MCVLCHIIHETTGMRDSQRILSRVHDCRSAYGEVSGLSMKGEIWTSVSADFTCTSVLLLSLLMLRTMKKALQVNILFFFTAAF